MRTREIIKLAEERGRKDYRRGKSFNAVPYADPEREKAWFRGWNAAREERLKR